MGPEKGHAPELAAHWATGNRASSAGAKQCHGSRLRYSPAPLIASAGVPEKQSLWEASATVAGERVVAQGPQKPWPRMQACNYRFVSSRNGPTEGCVVPAPSSPGARHAVCDQEAPLSPHTLPRWARPCLGGKKNKAKSSSDVTAVH